MLCWTQGGPSPTQAPPLTAAARRGLRGLLSFLPFPPRAWLGVRGLARGASHRGSGESPSVGGWEWLGDQHLCMHTGEEAISSWRVVSVMETFLPGWGGGPGTGDSQGCLPLLQGASPERTRGLDQGQLSGSKVGTKPCLPHPFLPSTANGTTLGPSSNNSSRQVLHEKR